MEKIALLPGGFKPPHAGHYKAAKYLSNESGAEVLVRIGSDVRDGITREMSIALWSLYTKDDNIKAVESISNSPLADVFNYVEKEAPKGTTVYIGTGYKDFPRFKVLTDPLFKPDKYKQYNPKDIKVVEIEIPPQEEGISGSKMREFIMNDQKELFQKYIPDHIDKDKAWNIVMGLDEDLYNPEDKVLDYMRGSEYKAGYTKPDDIEPGYKYRRGGMYTGGGMGHGGMYEGEIQEDGGGESELHIYDFDDTVAQVKTNIRVTITSPKGDYEKVLDVSSDKFPKVSAELEAKFSMMKFDYDFSEFEKDIEDAIISSEVLNKLKSSLKNPTVQTTILTARTEGEPVINFFKKIGLDPYIIPLGSMVGGKRVTGQDKADWIEKRINDKKGIKKVYFIDDSAENRKAVYTLRDNNPEIEFKIETPPAIKEMMGEGPQFGVLYHFTQQLSQVLGDDTLRGPVSLTRSLDSHTTQWLGDQPYFIFDKDKLRTKYKITPFKDTSDDSDYEPISQYDEMEEVIENDITNLARYTIKVVLPYSDENWENALKEKNIPYEVKTLDEMMGMMNKQEKAKHAKNMKRLNKDLKKQGDQYMEVPDYIKGTLTRKLHEEMSASDVDAVEDFADKKLNPVDIDLTSDHFFDRLNDPRNKKDISGAELIGFFKRLAKKKKEFVEFLTKYKEVVATDNRTNINIPFMKLANKAIAKTVMRKKDFHTSSPKLSVGETMGNSMYIYDEKEPKKMVKKESVFTKDWWKQQINEVMTETKANTHLTHLEELVLTQGQDGFNKAKSFLYELIKNLKGESNNIKNVSVKWDGAPAIFTGINPNNGKFFVGTKSVFNKDPKINYTSQDVDRNHGHAAGLAKKLKLALAYLPALGIKGILQGDFMFDSDDVDTQNIEEKPHYTFKPNTIRYAVEANSDLGRKINTAKIGIIFHTTYDDLSGGGASFGVDISGLNKSNNVWFDDAYFKDDTGVLLSDEEESFIINKIKEADSINVDYTNLPLSSLNTYLNSEIRQGEFLQNPIKSFENFKNWYQQAVDKSIEKVKRPETKEKKKQAGEQKIKEFDSQKQDIINIFKISKSLSEAKSIFITKYDKAVSTKHFIDNGDGTLSVTKAEGFVAVDHTENGIKLVDRLEFSRNNFNAGKPGA